MGAVASMTGFARAAGALSDDTGASVLVRSVNQRFLDVVVRHNLPGEQPELEAAVRERVDCALARGRVTVQLRLAGPGGSLGTPNVDAGTLVRLAGELERLQLPGRVSGDVRLGELLQLPGVVELGAEELVPGEAELERLGALLDDALEDLVAMRRREGERLVRQINDELAAVGAFVEWLRPRVEQLEGQLLERLRERIQRLVGDAAEVDADRLVTEASVLADKADVGEELTRLGSHLDEARRRLGEGGVVGKTLDFLAQEMNRELNTVGSKARDAEVAAKLVDAKAAVERLREQVQNLE